MASVFRVGLLVVACAVGSAAIAQSEGPALWTRAALKGRVADHLSWVSKYESFTVDGRALRSALASAPMEGSGKSALIELPNPSGGLDLFEVVNSPIQTPALEDRSRTKTYAVRGVRDRRVHGRVDLGPNGFNAFIREDGSSYIIAPPRIGEQSQVVTYFRADNEIPDAFRCYTQAGSINPLRGGGGGVGIMAAGDSLKTYRLAMNATGEYTTFYGSQAAATNGVVTSINRVNVPYQDDVAIRLNIVYNMCYTNAGTDPFTNNNGATMLGQNQATCDANVGNANYDIGHVFSTGGGGIAGLGVVGVTGQKARGVTGGPAPIGDPFDIDYVAHEVGHQYNGNHTFANCGGSGPVPFEPGSGSTIMAYAGICGGTNVQSNSDAYFHLINLLEITSFRDFPPVPSGTAVPNGNVLPIANAGPDMSVPPLTPVKLTASASDGNGDPLTYCWELWQTGTTATHRSRTGTSSPTRFVPPLATVLANGSDPWDPMLNTRVANWRVTARDNRAGGGGYGWDQMTLTVLSGTAFSVTSPNTAVSWPGGSTQTVTWNVGASGGTANVRILLSTNGGTSYGNGTATVLLASTPNDGTQTVTVPNLSSTQCRIFVEGITNTFYDVSNVNFTITNTTNPVPAITSLSPNNATAGGPGFNLVVTGTNFIPSSVVQWNGSNRPTTYNSPTQLTAAIPATDIAVVGDGSVRAFNPAPGGGTSNALTFTVNPIVLAPNAFVRLLGDPVSGGLAQVLNSDDDLLVGAFRWDGNRESPNLQWEFSTNSPVPSASRIDIMIEGRSNPAGLSQSVSAYNHATLTDDGLIFWLTSATDVQNVVSITTGAANYVGPNGLIKIKVGYKPINPTGRIVTASIDQVKYTVYP